MAPWHLTPQESILCFSLIILILVTGCRGETDCGGSSQKIGDEITLETFLNIPRDEPAFSDDLVNMDVYQTPVGFDLQQAIHNITDGPGYYMIKQAFSAADVQLARDRVLFYMNPYKSQASTTLELTEERHNNYEGMTWDLLNKGRIFSKIVQHPAILQLSRVLLGEHAQISSLSSNTVLPGMLGQKPHLDYPYYKHFFPSQQGDFQFPTQLGLQFVIMLTEFNAKNGGTAIRPHSQLNPSYPYDEEEFFANAIQAEGSPGDVVVFAGSLQHCAMPNKSKYARAGILQQMIPVYIKPFEDIRLQPSMLEDASSDLRQLLALDHPFPLRKEI